MIDVALRDPTNQTRAPAPSAEESVEDGLALCLSGGGYRAMLFHAGTILRLNELGVLRHVARVSSVSGGSILAGMLGLQWRTLDFDPKTHVASNLLSQVVAPILAFAEHTVDVPSVLQGLFLPFVGAADLVQRAYRRHLFGGATLQDLPSNDQGPRFVINATSVQTGVLFRFSRSYAGDYRIGRIELPKIALAQAVAASTAFPPVLSPMTLRLGHETWTAGDIADATALRDRVVLTDGGVYDNLGLETAFKRYRRLIVSDGGGTTEDQARPCTDWAMHSVRTLLLLDQQVRNLRKRMLVGAFIAKEREGAYFSMRTQIAKLPAARAWPIDQARADALAATPTRLAALDRTLAQRIVNHGHTMCDLTYRSHVDTGAPLPAAMPFPAAGI